MSEFALIEYSSEWYNKWNKFIDDSNNGTIFHRLDFLEYHGDRFKVNENHLIWLKGEEIFCVLPLGIFVIDNKKVVKSPYGGSFGGVICKKPLNYYDSSIIVYKLINYLSKSSVDVINITLPTHNLEKIPSDTLFFCLLEQGFTIINSDISSIVTLDDQKNESSLFTSRARNMARKARKENVIPEFNASVDDFWKVIEVTFSKLGKNPTHTYEEWKYLCAKFPDFFWNDVAYLNNKPIAGIGHIRINNTTDSSFYLCSDPAYYETQALSLLIVEALIKAKKNGYKYFDFGTSSLNMQGNENIFRFKESFGAMGVFRHTISCNQIVKNACNL